MILFNKIRSNALAISIKDNILLVREIYLQDFVFIHINKNAGSSIEQALGLHFEDRHKTAQEKIKEMGQARWQKKFTFTIVRNPWDRVVSHYFFRKKTNQTNLRTNPVEFNDWVKLVYLDKNPFYYDKPKMFMPQFDWIADESGKILVDYIGRFENLESDFKKICHQLDRNCHLPHEKKSSGRRNYREYYSGDSSDIVSSIFKKDVEHFGYKF